MEESGRKISHFKTHFGIKLYWYSTHPSAEKSREIIMRERNAEDRPYLLPCHHRRQSFFSVPKSGDTQFSSSFPFQSFIFCVCLVTFQKLQSLNFPVAGENFVFGVFLQRCCKAELTCKTGA